MLQKPRNSGSMNRNYKGRFSTVLMAVATADYQFSAIGVGAPGSASDGGVFQDWTFGKELINNRLALPPGEYLLPDSTNLR